MIAHPRDMRFRPKDVRWLSVSVLGSYHWDAGRIVVGVVRR
ncbi:hypothetical protein TPCCA_0214a [Treponema paraluiscuniculi Cuniculi A]|uniref:Uncharacterized protein n=2 Tax=Treponema paraluiscuniculi TaxID=53435 RepID=F7XS44_TREPU|nr:hypothetical protein TPCCA_0214a [Treponema paraluiscuniculi Cuniculi A]WKC72101.1 hypothetical protein TPLL2_0214a [Treponema paraluiscuniculi]